MLTLCVLLLAVSASAQRSVSMTTKVSFAFSVAGKALPAGEYKFSQSPGAGAITVRSSFGCNHRCLIPAIGSDRLVV